MKKDKYEFDDLIEIMTLLRSENGCPWDKEQTSVSLKKYLIEETYEVLEAIDLKDDALLCEELGDLLLQIVFHSEIKKNEEKFDINNVIDGISKKMISRHTHVFGEDKAETPDDVVEFWEANKKKEKGAMSQTEILKNVPVNLPALMRSYKVQQKAADVGFDWDDIEDVFKKIEEEVNELKEAYKEKDKTETEKELGDVLFALVNLARFLKIQPEIALSGTTKRFIDRFEFIEIESEKEGKKLKEMTLQEMDLLWNKAKAELSEEKNEN